MIHHFLDTSALVKRYAPEAGTDKVDAIFADPANQVVISRLCMTEWHSVLARKVCTGELHRGAYQNAIAHLYADVRARRILMADWDRQHFRRATRVLKQRGLLRAIRSLDALQLASALVLHERDELNAFVCADNTLCDLARDEGLAVINPED